MDMAGNVFEWVDSYYQAYPNSTANNSEFGEKNRVVRGGFFGSKTNESLKTTKRTYVLPSFITDKRDSFIGFRCVIEVNDTRLKNIL